MKMNIMLILFLMLLFAIIALAVLKKQKSTIVLAIIALCMIIGITGTYFFNVSFRDNVNIQLNLTDSHRYIIDNNTYYLPLPSKTALKYRTSDKSAIYITKSDLNEIVTLYRDVSNNGTFSEDQDDNRVVLSFEYNDYSFYVFIETYGNSRKILVDMIES